MKIGRDQTRVYRPTARGYIDRENSGKKLKKKAKRPDPLKRPNKKGRSGNNMVSQLGSPTWSPKREPSTPKRETTTPNRVISLSPTSFSQPLPKPSVR